MVLRSSQTFSVTATPYDPENLRAAAAPEPASALPHMLCHHLLGVVILPFGSARATAVIASRLAAMRQPPINISVLEACEQPLQCQTE